MPGRSRPMRRSPRTDDFQPPRSEGRLRSGRRRALTRFRPRPTYGFALCEHLMSSEPIKPKSADKYCRKRQGRVVARGDAVCFGRHCRLRRQGARDVAACGGQPGPAGIRARRHHEPAADMGHGLRAAGRHVSRGSFPGKSRYPPRLLSRTQRMPRHAAGFPTAPNWRR